MMGGMDGTRVNRTERALGAVLGVIVALLMSGPTAGVAHAAVAAPAGDAISIGYLHALGQVDLYVDPLCPFSGKMVRAQGDEIGDRIEAGTLRVNLRFVDFLDKYSASGTYDSRAIYATYVVAGQSQSSDIRGASSSRSFRPTSSRKSKDRRISITISSPSRPTASAHPNQPKISLESACRSVTTPMPSQPTTSHSCISFLSPVSRSS